MSRLAPPQFLFLTLNQRCNLRCQHCVYWHQDDDDKPNYLSWSRKQEVLTEFAELSPGAAVVICGGESMLDLDDYFSITTECRKRGLRCLSVINGTRVRDAAMADRLIREGPSEISVSLNSQIESLHDETRGVKGAFKLATNALRLLIEARARVTGCTTKIFVMGLIFEQNYRQLDGFYDFVLNDLQADKLKLNFIQPTFGGAVNDEFFAANYVRDPAALATVIRACDAKYRLNLSPLWLEQVQMYFRSIARHDRAQDGWAGGHTDEHICNTYERNIMVDLHGNARLCFSTGFPHMPLRQFGDLRRFWQTESAATRKRMKKCHHYCGISHSVRRENATLKNGQAGSLSPRWSRIAAAVRKATGASSPTCGLGGAAS